jgi:hypothetical protein
MQKKIFLQKNLRGAEGGSSLPKYLLLTTIALVVLYLIANFMLKPKSRDITKRPIPEKGQLLKELPKPPDNASRELAREMPPPAEPETQPPQVQPATPPPPIPTPQAVPQKPETQPPVAQAPVPEKTPPLRATATEPTPRDLFPKKGAQAVPAQPTAQKEHKPTNSDLAQKPATPGAVSQPAIPGVAIPNPAPAVAQKPVPAHAAAGKQRYAVQVGSFKERSDAEIVQRNLAKKGYDVILCSSSASNGGIYTYTVMTKPFDNVSKASTMVEQMKSEGRSSPTVIKLPAEGCSPSVQPVSDKKPQPKPAPKPSAKNTLPQ